MGKSEKTWLVSSKGANLKPREGRQNTIRNLNAQALELHNLDLNHYLAVT